MGDKLTGKIKWYNHKRGFGVIGANDGKEYFLHHSQLPSPLTGEIEIGTRLIFEITPRPRHKGGYEAINVELDNSLIPESPEVKNNSFYPQVSRSQSPDIETSYWFESYVGSTDSQPSRKKPIETKVVGVTYEGRQAIIALLSVGEVVQLVREPENPYDKNAIRVVRETGQCIGFISKSLAARLAPKFDEYEKPVEAVVTSITGGYYSDSNRGVRIRFSIPEVGDSEQNID